MSKKTRDKHVSIPTLSECVSGLKCFICLYFLNIIILVSEHTGHECVSYSMCAYIVISLCKTLRCIETCLLIHWIVNKWTVTESNWEPKILIWIVLTNCRAPFIQFNLEHSVKKLRVCNHLCSFLKFYHFVCPFMSRDCTNSRWSVFACLQLWGEVTMMTNALKYCHQHGLCCF